MEDTAAGEEAAMSAKDEDPTIDIGIAPAADVVIGDDDGTPPLVVPDEAMILDSMLYSVLV